jgi:hypothetical protein
MFFFCPAFLPRIRPSIIFPGLERKVKPMPANPQGWTSWLATRSGLKILLLLGLGLGVAGSAVWNRFADRLGAPAKAEVLAYQLCVGRDKGLCPKDTTFVQNVGEETVAKFAQKECAAYRARRIIVKDAPSKDCDCFLADLKCSSE